MNVSIAISFIVVLIRATSKIHVFIDGSGEKIAIVLDRQSECVRAAGLAVLTGSLGVSGIAYVL